MVFIAGVVEGRAVLRGGEGGERGRGGRQRGWRTEREARGLHCLWRGGASCDCVQCSVRVRQGGGEGRSVGRSRPVDW